MPESADAAVVASGSRARPGVWRRLSQGAVDAVLWVLGILGVLSLIAAVLAHIWGLSIILFSTGSMSPTIPAGSAALVQQIPAADAHVGDIVTIERKDALPVTHRITSITPDPAGGRLYTITMRGDANNADDADPYHVAQVRKVIASVPGVAVAISRSRDPRILAALTVIAGALVTWAFWPRKGGASDAAGDEPSAAVDLSESDGDQAAAQTMP
nr:signal peptidase I [Propionicimonas sp.]